MQSITEVDCFREHNRHFQYPFSFLLYLATAFLFGLPGVAFMLGMFFWKQKHRKHAYIIIISGLIIHVCWSAYWYKYGIPENRLALISFGSALLFGTIYYLLQKVLVRKVFSENDIAGFRRLRKADRGSFKQLMVRLAIWNSVLYLVGVCIFLGLGMMIFPYKTSTKTVYLLMSLKWSILFFIPGTIVAFVTNAMVFERILPQLSRIITACLIGSIICFLICFILFPFVDDHRILFS